MKNVRATIKEISSYMRLGYSAEKIRNKYPVFVETYPKLFDMLFDPAMNIGVLEILISHVEMIENGESQEKIEKAVGFELAKVYVYPNIDMSKEVNYPKF